MHKNDDLISRQMLLEYIHGEPVGRLLCDKYNLDGLIKQFPSAQPEIIRCRDCKWSDWYDAADGNRYCYCMETGAAGRTADDFCSYAECEEVSE